MYLVTLNIAVKLFQKLSFKLNIERSVVCHSNYSLVWDLQAVGVTSEMGLVFPYPPSSFLCL